MEYNIGDKLGNKICVGKVRVNPTIINDEPEFHYIWENIGDSSNTGSGAEPVDYLGQRITDTIIEYSNSTADKLIAYAFTSCSSLTTVDFPACISIGLNAFMSCSSLTTVNFPACTSIAGGAFASCSSLTTVDFPACISIGFNAFMSCSSLTTVNFPACTNISGSAFAYCKSLTTASFQACTSIASSAFARCSMLTTVILGASSVCTLASSNAFVSTPIASRTGYVYVPASLVDVYKSATNWTYFSTQISAIEDMPA